MKLVTGLKVYHGITRDLHMHHKYIMVAYGSAYELTFGLLDFSHHKTALEYIKDVYGANNPTFTLYLVKHKSKTDMETYNTACKMAKKAGLM